MGSLDPSKEHDPKISVVKCQKVMKELFQTKWNTVEKVCKNTEKYRAQKDWRDRWKNVYENRLWILWFGFMNIQVSFLFSHSRETLRKQHAFVALCPVIWAFLYASRIIIQHFSEEININPVDCENIGK